MEAIELESYRRRLICLREVVEQNFPINQYTSVFGIHDISRNGHPFLADHCSRWELTQLHLELSRALTRISRGIFGRCVVCQNPIEEARLRLIPYASKCHVCDCAREEIQPVDVSTISEIHTS